MKKRIVKVIETGSGDVVREIETTKTGAVLEKMVCGLLRNMDRDRYHVDDGEEPKQTGGQQCE